MLASQAGLQGIRATLIGAAVNVTLALAKGLAGYFGSSYALIADAVESALDVFGSIAVYAGLRIAIRPPDANHPYGHGKAEPIAATVVSLVLFVAAALIAVKSIHEIVTPQHAPAPWTLVVLAGVVLVKEFLFRYIIHVGERIQSTAVRADAWHHRSDAITSGVAFAGISIALAGGPGYESADDWAALVASAIIVVNAYILLRPAIAELTDAAPDCGVEAEVRNSALLVPGVSALEKCFIRKMGLEFYVDLHVMVDGGIPVREGHSIAHQVRDAIRTAVPRVAQVLVHIEPYE